MDLKTCQVCGKEYDKCKTPYIAKGHFQWNDVTCSPKCAMQYLAAAEEKQQAEAETPKRKASKSKKPATTTTEKDKVESQP